MSHYIIYCIGDSLEPSLIPRLPCSGMEKPGNEATLNPGLPVRILFYRYETKIQNGKPGLEALYYLLMLH